ncbi:Dimethylaniline monooxygenase, N-oxide-forming [Artemisia annua]|uniref:Dimethylaniline monooxygenase, N-oxide-forming n=1 Tax=Artemisia annua TaxID=35608 RepID=A0A2U1PL13_ARTAN|nr:Dimethylaniline monooxygenase, N-oxide-forming [Artemisia annua]
MISCSNLRLFQIIGLTCSVTEGVSLMISRLADADGITASNIAILLRALNVTIEEELAVIIAKGKDSSILCYPDVETVHSQDDMSTAICYVNNFAMEHEKAEEFVKGKRVVVVGFQKQRLDIAMECSSVNVVYRKDRWNLPDFSLQICSTLWMLKRRILQMIWR